MNLENKLENLPWVYYFNLDNQTDRRDYMEKQFEKWNIKNYTRISGTKYLASKVDEWRHLVIGDIYMYDAAPHITAHTMTHFEFFDWWLKNSTDPYLIIMEDDYDLELIEYWHFDWNYLMENIPDDWDCIQLGYESTTKIYFFLYPKQERSWFGPCLLNRRYVQKLVDLYFKDGYFIFNKKINNTVILGEGGSVTVDYSIANNGRVYCLPLITTNPKFGIESKHLVLFKKCSDLYYKWWKYERDKFSLEDFFIYNKRTDHLMTKLVYPERSKSYMRRNYAKQKRMGSISKSNSWNTSKR